jgi:hypothetical protein
MSIVPKDEKTFSVEQMIKEDVPYDFKISIDDIINKADINKGIVKQVIDSGIYIITLRRGPAGYCRKISEVLVKSFEGIGKKVCIISTQTSEDRNLLKKIMDDGCIYVIEDEFGLLERRKFYTKVGKYTFNNEYIYDIDVGECITY